jgi:hypothetical protein
MIFILTFAVFGASGVPRPFPAVKLTSLFSLSLTPNVMTFLFRYLPLFISLLQWAGNPAKGNVDHCNGNGALE